MNIISVVIPIYNVEKYLRQCVDSIIRQTYKNLEIILVDDGSPDGCPDICDQYALEDERIKVIHKTNGGLSDARNAALEIASGEWIVFVDSDDTVEPTFIETLLDTALKNEADIACCSYYKMYPDGAKAAASKRLDKAIFTGIEAVRDIFTAGTLCEHMAWNKIYKTALFKDNAIKYPVGKIHEDNFTTYKLFYFANKVAFVNRPLYNYLQRPDSIMGRKFDRRRLDVFEMVDECKAFFVNKGESLVNEIASMELLVALGVYSSYLQREGSDYESKMTIRFRITHLHNVIFNPLVKPRHKMFFILSKYFPSGYQLLRKSLQLLKR